MYEQIKGKIINISAFLRALIQENLREFTHGEIKPKEIRVVDLDEEKQELKRKIQKLQLIISQLHESYAKQIEDLKKNLSIKQEESITQ